LLVGTPERCVFTLGCAFLLPLQLVTTDAKAFRLPHLVRIDIAVQIGLEVSEGSLKRAVALRLATPRGPHNDHTKANLHGVE